MNLENHDEIKKINIALIAADLWMNGRSDPDCFIELDHHLVSQFRLSFQLCLKLLDLHLLRAALSEKSHTVLFRLLTCLDRVVSGKFSFGNF